MIHEHLSRIAGASGLRSESASTLLSMSAPLVLSWLGQRARMEGLDASGLGAWLDAVDVATAWVTPRADAQPEQIREDICPASRPLGIAGECEPGGAT